MRTIDRRYDAAGKILLPLILLLSSCSGQNGRQGPERSENREDVQVADIQPVMVFDTLVHDFGTIVEGEQVLCYFGYTNGGGEELLITSVEASCGCTTPSWSEQPLGPGEKGSLEIIFDTSGRSGIQRKVVTVISNAANQEVRLTIRADIENSIN